jgi:phenylalanyl-tRNA synthetase alpha chain
MLERIDQLAKQVQDDLATITDAATAEQFRLKYLAGSGAVKKLMALLKDIAGDQKKEFGRRANELRAKIETDFEARKAVIASTLNPQPSTLDPQIDVTQPGLPPRMGRQHVITQTIDGLVEVFGRMGFSVATGPEIEDEWHNFIALNIPQDHPARDPLDNFYIEKPAIFGGPAGSTGSMLRSQTSTIQIRVMEKTKPPVRVIAVGRVYRPDEHDATHYSMFHQVEGLYVDRKVSMVDLKTTLFQFVHAYFGPEAEVRLRPSFFPFTEPSAELDVKIKLRGEWRWMELGGCGMVDPNVFEAVGYDPEEWTGFAFGLGIERLAMRRYGITDIRWLFENDVRFLRQF